MQRLFTIVGCLALTGALVAGCGSSSKKSSSSSASTSTAAPAPAPSSTPTTAGSGTGSVVNVQLKDISFKPAKTTAKVGQTIKWTNEDAVDHNVTATQGETFKSKDFGMGKSYSYKLDKAGTISYVCTIHPNMKATVTVTK
jgi:plastocyanin